MNRQIKFRIWDVDEKSFMRIYDLEDFCDSRCKEWFNNENMFIVNQYTGLKDKNGKEIYEGDIVEWKGNFLPSHVIFEDGTFKFWDLTVSDTDVENWEIIGNIFENPELFKNE